MKQIVIASDRPPKELPDFEDRLRSRFEWGLIADIQPPDLETKVAILQKKAESEQTSLPVDVAMFIASNVRTNVRELEGALVRLIAWCSMHGVEITLPVTQQCLKQFIDTQVRKITIETIQRSVAEQFGMRVAELKQKNNSRQIVVTAADRDVPRQTAHRSVATGDRASVRRQAPHHGHALDRKDRRTTPRRQGPKPDNQQADGDIELSRQSYAIRATSFGVALCSCVLGTTCLRSRIYHNGNEPMTRRTKKIVLAVPLVLISYGLIAYQLRQTRIAAKEAKTYNDQLAIYGAFLKPGMTRAAVERELGQRSISFQQRYGDETRDYDDFVLLERFDSPVFYCSFEDANLQLKFDSRNGTPSTASGDPEDQLRKLVVYHQLMGLSVSRPETSLGSIQSLIFLNLSSFPVAPRKYSWKKWHAFAAENMVLRHHV